MLFSLRDKVFVNKNISLYVCHLNLTAAQAWIKYTKKHSTLGVIPKLCPNLLKISKSLNLAKEDTTWVLNYDMR
jgi:hypothetical protein